MLGPQWALTSVVASAAECETASASQLGTPSPRSAWAIPTRSGAAAKSPG